MSLAIKVENLSKAYQLGEIGTGTLSRDLERWVAKVRGKEDPFLQVGETNDRASKGCSDVVWSLRDLNFEINQGDAVGIIGRNGAGKSTLLKLLSRVTSPTIGEIKIKGRIACLLEVGTGFHPELTGRENIYLNGAILGMRKKEIFRRFDEIVDFAGVERYIDTPVKRYSSGMYLRLAFSVAAHLESEILIVDEVLAVGDAEFQKKCLGKLNEVNKGEARTILFVSHNMGAIRNLCSKGICLNKGRFQIQGKINEVVNSYLKNGQTDAEIINFDNSLTTRAGNGAIRFLSAQILDEAENVRREFFIGDTLQIRFTINNLSSLKTSAIGIYIKTPDDIPVIFIVNKDSAYKITHISKIETFLVSVKNISLYPGTYNISLTLADGILDVYDYIENCLSFTIMEGGPMVVRPLPRHTGLFFLSPEWKKISDYSIL